MTPKPPKATVVFSTVGRPQYGFDVFYVPLHQYPLQPDSITAEQQLTDGVSVNFNAQFIDDDHPSIVFISERTGTPRIYKARPGLSMPQLLPTASPSIFHDRPIVRNNRLYFVSAHEQPHRHFDSWSAVYSTSLLEKTIARLTPYESVDYSPAVSRSGKFIAVASYGSRPWGGAFHELRTSIVVFPESDVTKRVVVSERGGWPTWSGDSTIYFHRRADDGWWSIFKVELAERFEISDAPYAPVRVTPTGLHCFTPATMHDGNKIAVATRRPNKSFRHIEIFDLESKTFYPVTDLLNPNFHHYNPFVSLDSAYLGYHRFRGESGNGESTIPHLEPVVSPVEHIRMLRINGNFPTFSPKGDLIAFNPDFDAKKSGIKIIKSDGSKRWTLTTGRTAFYNSWSPTETHAIFTSVGPIFASVNATVQIARVTFDPANLDGHHKEIPCEVKVLTKEETGNNAFPSCSPDGKAIVFRSGRSGNKNLYIVDAVHGEFLGDIRQLTEGPWIDTMPSWSPRGDMIAFSSNRHNPNNPEAFSIYVVKPDGSDLRRIHVAGGENSDEVNRERINHVCFSEDGEWLLFACNLGGVTAEPVSLPNHFQPYGDLYLVRLDGSGLRRLTCNPYENGTPTWRTVADFDMGCLCLDEGVGDNLAGEFEDPLWIKCDV